MLLPTICVNLVFFSEWKFCRENDVLECWLQQALLHLLQPGRPHTLHLLFPCQDTGMHGYNGMLSIIHFCLIFSWIKMKTMWLSVISMRGCPAPSKLAISVLLDQTIFDLTLSLFRVFSSPYARGFGLVSLCTLLSHFIHHHGCALWWHVDITP